MIRIVLGFTLLLVSFNAFGQHTDTLFVWAKNGLKVRAEPNAKAKVLATLPYGAPLNTLRTTIFSQDSIEVIPPFEMSNKAHFEGYYVYGFWQKVVWEGKEGYVFSGYISNLKPYVQKSGEVGYEATLVGFSKWLKQNAIVIDSISIVEHGSYRRASVSNIYSNHIVEQISGDIDDIGTYTVRYIFPPNFNFQDGFILANYFHGFHFPDLSNRTLEYYLYAKKEKDYLNFVVGTKASTSGLTISYENGVLILIFNEGSC